MSSAADSDLARRDRDLPGLATLLEPDRIAQHLTRPGSATIDRIQLLNLRYKPGTNCVAAYRLRRGDESELVYAKAHGPDATVKLHKARAEASSAGFEPASRIYIEALGIIVYGFLDDAKLPVLSRLASERFRHRLMVRVMGEGVIPQARLETLAYKPERRYVARYGPDAAQREAVVKFYGAAGHRAARAVCGTLESRDLLRLPRKCGGSKRHNILAFEWLTGPTLREMLDGGAAPDVAGVGTALARLHEQNNAPLRTVRFDARLAELRNLAETLGFLCPALRDDAVELAERLAKDLASPIGIRAAIHGDFYDKQVVMGADHVGIVDLDEAMLGDPRQDLGQFIAHLERDRLMGSRLEGVDQLCGSLLEGYQETSGRTLEGLLTFVAEGLLRLAHHPFRRHHRDWPQQTEAILERARALLAGASLTG